MDPLSIKKLDLARLILEKIRESPSLLEYLEVSEDGIELDSIPLANLFYHMEQYYSRAATVKSALQFLTEDLGIRRSHCIILVATADDELYRTTASIIASETEGFLVARATNLIDAQNLMGYFSLGKWSCGLITEYFLDEDPCYSLLRDCKNLPSCVIVPQDQAAVLYIALLAEGASVIIPKVENFPNLMKAALFDMFLEGA